MKYVLLSITISLFAVSCNEDCITTMIDPGQDPTKDCPALMANFGDPCDDGNPDTDSDVVDEMCVCMGTPVSGGCEGTLYASRIEVEGVAPTGWYFDETDKVNGQIGGFSNIEEKNNGFLFNGDFDPNASAYDPLNSKYVMSYQYNAGFPNPLYCAQTNVFNSLFLEQEAYYGAPVFFDGALYAIDIYYDAPTVQYSIVEIDQSTGIPTVINNGTISVNSPMNNNSTSSTSNEDGNIYFMSFTNLIVYNIASDISTYKDVDASYSLDNQLGFAGLEYNLDQNLLLAMKLRSTNSNTSSDLVSISTDANYTVNQLFDIKANLSNANDGEISFEFYSSAYSQCDNTYYISEIVELEVESVESFLLEIDLDDMLISERVVSGAVYGLEMVE